MNKRIKQESDEQLETIVNGAPKGRYQTEQQVQNTMDADAKAPQTGFVLEKKKTPGAQLKQEAVAKVLNNADSGSANSGMGISAAGLRGVSGATGGVLGAANGTPKADQARKDSRYGKKLDRIGTKLNFTPSEQVVVEYDESKPLADSADQDQGYNGTYRNEYGRSQKKVGNVPSELLFDRSVDYIYKDQLYFGQGQYVKQNSVNYDDTPTQKVEPGVYGIEDYPAEGVQNYSLAPGNYLMRNMHIKVNSVGQVQELYFDSENITPSVDAEACNRASAAGMIDRNAAEIDRQSMDAKAGDEKADIWTPLARAIKQPTQVVALLRDMEQMTGNEVLLGYKKASLSMSHQLNRAAKDGQTIVDPAVEALIGLVCDSNDPAVFNTVFKALPNILNDGYDVDPDGSHYYPTRLLNRKGQAGLMIQLYDSIGKYTSKQDILLQPRSFRMHLQTADNNMNPLHVNKRFAQVIDAQEVYSTINRDYDPLLPICVSDKAAIIHRHDFNRFCAKVKCIDGFTFKTGVSGGTTFVNEVIVPGALTAGAGHLGLYLHALLSDNTSGHGEYDYDADAFTYQPDTSMDASVKTLFVINDVATSYGDDTGVVIDGVTYYEFEDAPLDLDYCIGHDIIVKKPNDVTVEAKSIKGALKGGAYAYAYADLRNNYVVKAEFPLIKGIVDLIEQSIGAKIYALTGNGELTIPMIHSTQYFSLWSFLLCAATPFIVNARINSLRDVLYYEKNIEYPFSQLEAIGEVGVKSFANFKFNDYDSPIECGLMKPAVALRWTLPEFFWKPKATISGADNTASVIVMPFYMNQENFVLNPSDSTATVDGDKAAMTMPSIRSGARLADLDALYGMTEKDIRLSYDMALPFIPDKASAAYAYKYGANTDGIITFAMTDDHFADISIAEWLTVPREVGYIMDAPYGLLTTKVQGVSGSTATEKAANIIAAAFAGMNESATRGTSFRIKCWAADGFVKHTTGSGSQNILDTTAINVNRAANFKQTWYEVVSNGKRPTFDAGMLFSLNHLLNNGSLAFGESEFNPFVNDASHAQPSSLTVVSFQKAFWTRIQKLPFVISPFEGCDYTASGTNGIDPYEIAIYFGLCGFRASDYRESVYNREKEVVNQGYLFVNDPWIEASPIFKEGAISSGVTVTRGYEV